MLERLLRWIWDNREWVFSGVGVVALTLLWKLTHRRKDHFDLRPTIRQWIAAWWLRRRQAKILVTEWPRFQAQIKSFSYLVAEGHPRSARWLLRRLSSHDAAGNQVTSRNERLLVEGIVRYVNAGLFCATEDAKRTPRSVAEAERVVRSFEFLVGGLTSTHADIVLLSMPPDGPTNVDASKNWRADFDQFIRDYRSFANDANVKIEHRLFATSSSIPD